MVMTIDEAINSYERDIEDSKAELDYLFDKGTYFDVDINSLKNHMSKCEQLVTWLKELKVLREVVKEKEIPRKPISKQSGSLGTTFKICPSCKVIVYDSNWNIDTQKKYFTRRCMTCGQSFTELGKCIGEWSDE